MTANPNANYLTAGKGSGGCVVNRSDEYLSFFGAAPVAQPSITQMVTPVLSQVATSGKWGFSSSTAAYLIFTRLRALVTKLDALNLVDKL